MIYDIRDVLFLPYTLHRTTAQDHSSVSEEIEKKKDHNNKNNNTWLLSSNHLLSTFHFQTQGIGTGLLTISWYRSPGPHPSSDTSSNASFQPTAMMTTATTTTTTTTVTATTTTVTITITPWWQFPKPRLLVRAPLKNIIISTFSKGETWKMERWIPVNAFQYRKDKDAFLHSVGTRRKYKA